MLRVLTKKSLARWWFLTNPSEKCVTGVIIFSPTWLVVSTPLKNMLLKLDHFPKRRGENTNLFVATT